MEKTEIFDLLDDYSRATHLPISCFIENEIVKKTMDFVADFNLPMLLLDCLPKELPPVWYSISPEYMYMAGLTVPEINMKIFIGLRMFLIVPGNRQPVSWNGLVVHEGMYRN